jgi:uncharacterized protein YllA (UPF0747 family)
LPKFVKERRLKNMPTTWLRNNDVKISIIESEGKDYMVYVKTTGGLIPKLVEDVTTGKRISYKDIRNELPKNNNNSNNLEKTIDIMINKLKDGF